MKLSIIIPAYNEEATIGELLTRVKSVDLENIDREIIVVDDGSTDKTSEVVAGHKDVRLIKSPANRGKGYSIRKGIKHSTGDIIIIQDADLEYDPNDYPNLIEPILQGKAKVVYGSRKLQRDQDERNQQFLRNNRSYRAYYAGGKALTILANILYGSNITDEATCYKVFKADVIKNIDLKCNRFEFCPEVTAKVLKKGYKIFEVPTPYYPRTFSEGKKINWKDGVQAAWTLLKYRFFD